MEAMKKIFEAEQLATSLVSEARAYKIELIKQANKNAEEEASAVLSKAESTAAKYEEETNIQTFEIREIMSREIKAIEQQIERQIATKKTPLIKQLIKEVSGSDRSR